jgi:hypothetical protein
VEVCFSVCQMNIVTTRLVSDPSPVNDRAAAHRGASPTLINNFQNDTQESRETGGYVARLLYVALQEPITQEHRSRSGFFSWLQFVCPIC